MTRSETGTRRDRRSVARLRPVDLLHRHHVRVEHLDQVIAARTYRCKPAGLRRSVWRARPWPQARRPRVSGSLPGRSRTSGSAADQRPSCRRAKGRRHRRDRRRGPRYAAAPDRSLDLDRLLAFDADAADLEDNCEPPHRVTRNTGQDRLLPRRLGNALRIMQALALALLLVTVPHAVARSDQAPAVTLPLSAAEAPTQCCDQAV